MFMLEQNEALLMFSMQFKLVSCCLKLGLCFFNQINTEYVQTIIMCLVQARGPHPSRRPVQFGPPTGLIRPAKYLVYFLQNHVFDCGQQAIAMGGAFLVNCTAISGLPVAEQWRNRPSSQKVWSTLD